MSQTAQPIEVARGATAEFDLYVTVDGDAEDLTGAEITMSAKLKPGAADALFTLTSSPPAGIVIEDQTSRTGHATVTIPRSATLGASATKDSKYVFDVWRKIGSDYRQVVVESQLVISPNVTEPA